MANVAGGAAVERLERSVPVRRLGTPEDIGAICVYLASDEAGWTKGAGRPQPSGSIRPVKP